MPDIIRSSNVGGPVVLVSREIKYTFPLSYAYLAGYLKEQSEEVKVLFRPPVEKADKFIEEIIKMKPLMVGFGNLYPELEEIGRFIEKFNAAGRDFPIVIGGQMVSPTPKFAVKVTGADFGVLGEGEIILYQLVRALREGRDPVTVKGLAVRREDDVILTGPGEEIADISKLPKIPYEFFPESEWLNIGRWYARYRPQPHWRFNDRVINVHSGRGCPYNCNFCYHHSKPRYRPMDVVMKEAREALERFNGNMLYFSDETALASPKRVKELVDGIKGLPRKIEFSVSCRFDILDRIDDELLKEMKGSGCRIMGLGIESGSDRVLKIIGKRYPVDTIRRGLDRLKKVGILPTVSIMVGQLSETKEDVEMSIALMKESVRNNKNIEYAFTITTPFPGSQLYEHIFQNKLLKDDKEFYDIYFRDKSEFKHVVNLSAMSDDELVRMYNKIKAEYAKEKSKVLNKAVVPLEFMIKRLSKYYNWLDDKIFQKMVKRSKGNRVVRGIYNIQAGMYVFLQTCLDNLRLKLRGII